jgi:hypothetical protein
MQMSELKRRLELFLAEQPVERCKVSGSSVGFRVELTLKPNSPITERFIRGLEIGLRQEIASLLILRIRRNVFIIRFSLKPSYHDDSPADRIEELPAPCACVGRSKSWSDSGSVIGR